VGVSPYLTLDKTGNLEKIFLESRKTEKTGDVGGSILEEEFRPQFDNSFDSNEEEFKIEEYKATLQEVRRRLESDKPY